MKKVTAKQLRDLGFVIESDVPDDAWVDASTVKFVVTGLSEEIYMDVISDWEVQIEPTYLNFHHEFPIIPLESSLRNKS
jgi:hypothetical protein